MKIGKHVKETKKKEKTDNSSVNEELFKIYQKALDKIQSGEFDVIIFDQEDCLKNGTDQRSEQEEVELWMITKTMMQRGDKRYKNVVKYIKNPRKVSFNTKTYKDKEIIFFVSPQTAKPHSNTEID